MKYKADFLEANAGQLQPHSLSEALRYFNRSWTMTSSVFGEQIYAAEDHMNCLPLYRLVQTSR